MEFKKYEKALNAAGYLVAGDQVTTIKGDVVGQMDPYGEFHYKDMDMAFVICEAMRLEVKEKTKAPKAKKAKAAPVKSTDTCEGSNDWYCAVCDCALPCDSDDCDCSCNDVDKS